MSTRVQVHLLRCWWLLLSIVAGLAARPAQAQRPGRGAVAIAPATDRRAPATDSRAPATDRRAAATDSRAPDSPAVPPDAEPSEVAAADGIDSTQQRAPMFPGGEAALLHFIRERLRYPPLAARNRVEGKVIVSFWVDERGHPYGFGVLKGPGGGLDEEALRILRDMPAWTPALINGRPTLLQLRIPVVFRLAE